MHSVLQRGREDNLLCVLNLLSVDGIARELTQMDKFKMQGPKLCQDTAPSWGPAPAPTGPTTTESKSKPVSITAQQIWVGKQKSHSFVFFFLQYLF